MRSALFALRAAAGAATVLALAAGPAYAGDGEEDRDGEKHREKVTALVVPATTKPGGDVDIQVHGCKGKHGSVRSKAFVADAELSGRQGKGGPLYGDTTVKSRLDSGSYPLTVHCDGRDHHDAGTVHVTHHPAPSPVAPVRAGGGGTAVLAADAPRGGTEEQGPSTPHTVIGLVLAGVAAVAVAFRSTRRRRRTRAD
ncbi:hypothetical protein AMK26_00890 [Streptomyces sp. CB03234]|uniref:hypothetical protein n=1 Tax=Streptomyces sp. (strain CB03234) TaxID=1703937 RepID=UPI00093C3B6E|nr:hypothetical protein [Streptomyces sp. CB03234]OKK07683.1 hypothetical protein AMK26_00890 [Streptomyces sp. CB03234]